MVASSAKISRPRLARFTRRRERCGPGSKRHRFQRATIRPALWPGRGDGPAREHRDDPWSYGSSPGPAPADVPNRLPRWGGGAMGATRSHRLVWRWGAGVKDVCQPWTATLDVNPRAQSRTSWTSIGLIKGGEPFRPRRSTALALFIDRELQRREQRLDFLPGGNVRQVRARAERRSHRCRRVRSGRAGRIRGRSPARQSLRWNEIQAAIQDRASLPPTSRLLREPSVDRRLRTTTQSVASWSTTAAMAARLAHHLGIMARSGQRDRFADRRCRARRNRRSCH